MADSKEKRDVDLPPTYSVPSFSSSSGSGASPYAIDIRSAIGPAFQPGAAGAGGLRSSLGVDGGGNKPEYLFRDEFVGGKRKASWNERLFYGVGTNYMLGLTSGGMWGFVEGLRNPEAVSARLKFNSVLNAMTRRGPFLGNSLGVVSLMYYCIDGAIVTVRKDDDYINQIASGALAGLLFKSTAGVRAAGIATVLGGGVVAAYLAVSDYIEDTFR